MAGATQRCIACYISNATAMVPLSFISPAAAVAAAPTAMRSLWPRQYHECAIRLTDSRWRCPASEAVLTTITYTYIHIRLNNLDTRILYLYNVFAFCLLLLYVFNIVQIIIKIAATLRLICGLIFLLLHGGHISRVIILLRFFSSVAFSFWLFCLGFFFHCRMTICMLCLWRIKFI